MFCRNCGNKLNESDTFCTKCGTKKEVNVVVNNNINDNPLKSFNKLFITSSIIFFIILLIDLFFIKLYLNEDNGMAGLFELFALIITSMPSLALITISIINISSLFKCKKHGVVIQSKTKLLSVINLLYIILTPCFIFLFVFAEQFKTSGHDDIMNQKLNELYGSSYEVLDNCSYSNTGGDYYIEYLLKLSDFEYPIIAHLDLNDYFYDDNYDELNNTKHLNYQSYLDNVFNDKTIALMNLNESDTYKRISLNILMTNDKLNNKSLLKYNIEQVINKYTNQFQNYNFNLSIYFTRKIDESKVNDYYVLLNGGGSSCDSQFSKKINKSNLKVVSIYIREDTNISQEIESSIENIIYLSDRY